MSRERRETMLRFLMIISLIISIFVFSAFAWTH